MAKKKVSKPAVRAGSFKKIANKINAENRWNLSGRMRPEVPNIPNEHLILEMVASYGMTRRQITENLLLYPRNVDCIIDADQRATVCAWLGINEPSMADRVQYVKEQVVRSSAGGEVWRALLDGESIKDLGSYFRLRLKRLDEQVGRAITQESYRRIKADEGKTNTAGAMKLSGISDIEIPRHQTGVRGLDLLGGMDDAETVGFCIGDLWLIAGAPGVGKTKIALWMAAIASSPQLNGVSLYNQGEFDLPTFKRRYCASVVKGDEDLYISDKRSVNDIVAMMYAIKPRWVFIDSKDKITEASNLAGWNRVQRRLKQVAQDVGATVFLISHLNKDGSVKGGTTPQHDVDGVLVVDWVKDSPGLFSVWAPKNRGGKSGNDRKATFRHIGTKVLCVAEPDVYKFDAESGGNVLDNANPILAKLPESVIEEEALLKEEAGLLDKITFLGIESLTDEEKTRLKYITQWRVSKSEPETQRRLKEQQKETRQRLRDEKRAAKDTEESGDGFDSDSDSDEELEE